MRFDRDESRAFVMFASFGVVGGTIGDHDLSTTDASDARGSTAAALTPFGAALERGLSRASREPNENAKKREARKR